MGHIFTNPYRKIPGEMIMNTHAVILKEILMEYGVLEAMEEKEERIKMKIFCPGKAC